MNRFGGRPGVLAGPFVFRTRLSVRSVSAGFSLVELVVVLILLGIMSAVFIPRWQGGSGLEERGFRDQVVAALRYAQKSAIAARRTVCAGFATSPSVLSVRISSAYGAPDCSTGSALVGPDGQDLVLTATPPAAFASVPGSVIFDAAGRPGAAASISFAGLPGALDINVAAETGYVH
jgi:MSHA pilin protein MshC